MRPMLAIAALLFTYDVAQAISPPQFVLTWGSLGSLPGQFESVQGVAIDDAGFVYVVDQGNHRVQKFTPTGVYVSSTLPGKLSSPVGITHHAGEIYVVDWGNKRLQVLDTALNLLRVIGIPGIGPGALSYPIDVAVDGGFVYVSDEEAGQASPLDDRVEKYTTAGLWVASWNVPSRAFGIHASDGKVYVGGNLISVFDTNGNSLGTLGGIGSGPGQFLLAAHIARDAVGNFYVGDNGNHRVQMFDPSFAYLTEWGGMGNDPGQFIRPNYLAVDAAGDIYVTDHGNHRVQKFAFPPVAVESILWSDLKRAYR